jgi:hypothetical protein
MRDRQYRVEIIDPSDGQPCLLGLFGSRKEARRELRREWDQWKTLAAEERFCHSLTKRGPDRFLVRTPSGNSFIYRVIDPSFAAA